MPPPMVVDVDVVDGAPELPPSPAHALANIEIASSGVAARPKRMPRIVLLPARLKSSRYAGSFLVIVVGRAAASLPQSSVCGRYTEGGRPAAPPQVLCRSRKTNGVTFLQ
jgi:hypothetical protein